MREGEGPGTTAPEGRRTLAADATAPGGRPGPRARAATWFLAVIAVVLVGMTMRATAVVLVPVFFSIFLALVVSPVRDAVARRMPAWLGWLGHLAAMSVIVLVLCVFAGGVWIAGRRLVQRIPELAQNVQGLLPEPGEDDGLIDDAMRVLSEFSGDMGGRMAEFATGTATGILNSATGFLFSAILVFFVTLLMLIEGPRWRDKLASATGTQAERRWAGVIDVLAHKLRLFLVARAAVGALTAAIYVAWLWLFGVDLLLIWGLLAFLFCFIPNIGAVISGSLPALYALLTEDFGTAAIIALGLLVIEQVTGNYIDPKVQGRQISLSPLVVLLAILFWGWFWGVAGLILAVPVTIALVVFGAQVPVLRPFALFLTDRTTMEGLDEVTSR